jgi:hypothetical protein
MCSAESRLLIPASGHGVTTGDLVTVALGQGLVMREHDPYRDINAQDTDIRTSGERVQSHPDPSFCCRWCRLTAGRDAAALRTIDADKRAA